MTPALALLLQGPPSVTAHGAGHLLLFDEAARLGAAVAVGGALGLNRSLRGKAAGLRTHALVALGAAAVTAAASHGGDPAGATRVMQGVITGIGFVGAGVILHPGNTPLRRRPKADANGPDAGGPGATGPDGGSVERRHSERHDVRGLTTAASVWVAAGLGVTAGLGLYSLVLFGALFALAVLTGGGGIEDGVRRRLRRRARRRKAARRAVKQARREAAGRAALPPAPPPRPPRAPRA